jgi:chemotaxis protein CheX
MNGHIAEPPVASELLELVADLFRDVWAALTTLDLQRLSPGHGPAPQLADGPTALVHISGRWSGTVMLRLTATLGNRATATVMGLEGEDPSREDVRDITGEIANVLGGKLKATLPGPCQLSLPTVVDGLAYTVHLVSSRSMGELWFASNGQALSVSVWRKDDNHEERSP